MNFFDKTPRQSLRILLKASILFLIFNYAFALIPSSALWKISLYNNLIPGRPRFPQENDLNLLFDTHEINNSLQKDGEFKIIVLGHSSTWGHLLDPQETFSGLISEKKLQSCDGKIIHLYNLGYPKLSVFKDLLILDRAMSYEPDAIIWMVTLNSILRESKQHPIINYNAAESQSLIDRYQLPIKIEPNTISFSSRTFLNRREEIARFIKFQLDGMNWFVAGENTSERYIPIGQDVDADLDFGGLPPPELDPNIIMFEIIEAGIALAGDIPLIIVNEPIQIVTKKNSDIRYNHHYPRWAYDQYHQMMQDMAQENNWLYADLWDIVPPTEFTDTAVHRTLTGEQILADEIMEIIEHISCP